MSRVKTLKSLFKRYRRPGDVVFAWAILALALFLLSQLWSQTTWRPGNSIFAQPRFWPAVSLIGMAGFAALHLVGSLCSERIFGRWPEVLTWLASLEYALWFILYAIVVPILGYLPTTLLFAVGISLRIGYRSAQALAWAAASGLAIVLLFKTFLQVRLPAGQVYHYLPDGLRQLMQTYF